MRSTGFGAKVGAGVLLSAFAAAGPAAAEAICSRLLTAAELAEVAAGAEPMAAMEHAPGHSECTWMFAGPGEPPTLAFTHWTPAAVREALIPADTAADYYAMLVGSAEEVSGTKGRPLAGAGQKSALFESEGVRNAYLLTKEGVAHLVAGGLTAAQFEAAVRAAATP